MAHTREPCSTIKEIQGNSYPETEDRCILYLKIKTFVECKAQTEIT